MKTKLVLSERTQLSRKPFRSGLGKCGEAKNHSFKFKLDEKHFLESAENLQLLDIGLTERT